MSSRTYTDTQLADAVRDAHSWRGVLRNLGLSATSAGSQRSVRRHADRLGLSYLHFTGQRRWSDAALREAVDRSTSWQQVAETLGLISNGSACGTLRAHSERLRLSTSHFVQTSDPPPGEVIAADLRLENLRDAGSLFAATWFVLHGAKISWPLEPCRYDLVIELDGALRRVQVKTTQATGPRATARLANSRHGDQYIVYTPGEIDDFFVIDGELNGYVIPYEAVAGYTTIQLNRYGKFLVARNGSMVAA